MVPAPRQGIVAENEMVIEAAQGDIAAGTGAATGAETGVRTTVKNGAGTEAGIGVVIEGERGAAEVVRKADQGPGPELDVVVGVLLNVLIMGDSPQRKGIHGTAGGVAEITVKTTGGVEERGRVISPVGIQIPRTMAIFQSGHQTGVGRKTQTG